MSAINIAGMWMTAMGLTLPRIIGAFLLLPLMTAETVPPMVRNSFYVSIGLIALPIATSGVNLSALNGVQWPIIIVKELFLGLSIGLCFGAIFWAIGAAGSVIDTQVGMGMASIFDPIQGHTASVHGQFLSQMAAWLFMASGGFLVFLDLLLSSYAMWPVTAYFPSLQPGGMTFFIGQFSYLTTAILVLASPVLVLMLLVDLSFGLVNRYAQQLNVFALTMPIKAWVATAMILLMLGTYIEIVLARLGINNSILRVLDRVFSP